MNDAQHPSTASQEVTRCGQAAKRAAPGLAAASDEAIDAALTAMAALLTERAATASQLQLLAKVPFIPYGAARTPLPGGLFLTERHIPIGVVGANFEARPAVTIDVASQLLKSRNAGVLRTGAAALGSASVLADEVIAPALAGAGL